MRRSKARAKPDSDGYNRYITSYRCDDKQGEIARQSVEITALQAELDALRRRVGEAGKCKHLSRSMLASEGVWKCEQCGVPLPDHASEPPTP